ncbi:hypothetical protein LQW54_006830 [Pestalotiopsis sp. IQ-011]
MQPALFQMEVAPEIEDYWPRRLLHVPSMTSYAKAEECRYNGTRRPRYNILSYTWGRWEVIDPVIRRSLPVQGVPWKIPTVEETHFTVETFHMVLKQMVQDDIEWIWVDIACIDQENSSFKMDEVGKQASIFKNAANTFVWVCHSSSDALTRSLNVLESRSAESWYSGGKLSAVGLIQDIYDAAKTWFSSLWTLQEIVMRNDALILSATAEPVTVESRYLLHMIMLINTCMNIHGRLSISPDEGTDPEENGESLQQSKTIISNILQLIAQAGFYYTFSTNPNVQYGTAKHRKTRDEVDRVYAIMQIYNIRVGQSLRPNDRPSVQALI